MKAELNIFTVNIKDINEMQREENQSQQINSISVSGLRIRLANLFFKLLTCFLYIFRVITDNDPTFAAW